MSESKTIDYYSRDKTIVLWKVEDYPIASSMDVRSIYRNIKIALSEMGFHGFVQIKTFCDVNQDEDELRKVGIIYPSLQTTSTSASAYSEMALEMIFSHSVSSNFWIIAKQRPEGDELHRIQGCMKSRGGTVLVVQDTTQAIDFACVKSLVECTRVFGGGKPRSNVASYTLPGSPEVSKMEEDTSKIVNFSERMTSYLDPEESNLVIFWDVVDCPFPTCQNPDKIYCKIFRALRSRGVAGGFGGDPTIWAYVDDENNGPWSGDEYLRQKTWKTRIYFLPGGASRLNRMFNDMLLLAMDARRSRCVPYHCRVMVFSDQFKVGTDYFGILRDMHDRLYNPIVLVTPAQHQDQDVNNPESSEWPGLLIDQQAHSLESPWFDSSEPKLKRYKADEETTLEG